MARRSPERLLEALHEIISALPDVFSAVQWGGRAYKLPRPDGTTKKPRLLAFVTLKEKDASIHVGFKLPKDRAADAVDQYAWLNPSTFGTHGQSGWVDADITQKRQLAPLGKLLSECRATFTVNPPDEPEWKSPGTGKVSNAEARRIDRVMGALKADGWSPPEDDAF